MRHSRDPRLRDPDPREASMLPGREMPPDIWRRPFITPPLRRTTQQGRPPDERRILDWPPWVAPPFGARPIDAPQNRTTVAIGVGNSVQIEIERGAEGFIGVIWAIGTSTSDAANTRYTTRINRQPVPPIIGVVGLIGLVETPTKLQAPIIIPSGMIFDVLVENLGAAIINVAVRVQGWWYA